MKLRKFLIAAVAVMGLSSLTSCNYNSLVEKQQSVDQSWAEVENQYQRRSDLIPNLVSTVKGYAAHEEGTFTKVTEARAKATSITIDAEDVYKRQQQRTLVKLTIDNGTMKDLEVIELSKPSVK